ncbi:hypothetical protein PSTT_02634 [Puccinia striiformis]|uniref:Uncharacterized protein n=1 Tax=Puccinia striiformis TaxID=27350 RepID=A0A2S4VZ96_9BASI|nr:hypothetical protein PSTT_02634 [Puccinia striiformis]
MRKPKTSFEEATRYPHPKIKASSECLSIVWLLLVYVALNRFRSPQPEPYPSDLVDDVEMSNNPYNPIWPINQMSKRLQMRSKGIKLGGSI